MPIESEDQIVDLFVQKMESEGDITECLCNDSTLFLLNKLVCNHRETFQGHCDPSHVNRRDH